MATINRTTQHTEDSSVGLAFRAPLPGLLLAAAPAGAAVTDRARITESGLVLGREAGATWTLADARLSKRHARFQLQGERVVVEDLGSANGTFVNGERCGPGAHSLATGDLVRCGDVLLVTCADLGALELPGGFAADDSMAGRFHSPAIHFRLREAAAIGKHLLLSGESGAGKELAARSFARLLSGQGRANETFVAHNGARFTSEDEATAALFGVGTGVFSGVRARAGLIEQAMGGVLFLDEVHVLPSRVQRSLLRYIEDGQWSRIGETQPRSASVVLVFGTNLDVTAARASDLLAFDLVNRLQAVHVPSLAERRADIPDIFVSVVNQAAFRQGVEPGPLVAALTAEHLETILLIPFAHRNVRELVRLADLWVARVVVRREPPREALGALLTESFPGSPVVRRSIERRARAANPMASAAASPDPRAPGWSRYEMQRELIIATYVAAGRNLSETERRLKARGISATRRHLADYLQHWGVRPVR